MYVLLICNFKNRGARITQEARVCFYVIRVGNVLGIGIEMSAADRLIDG